MRSVMWHGGTKVTAESVSGGGFLVLLCVGGSIAIVALNALVAWWQEVGMTQLLTNLLIGVVATIVLGVAFAMSPAYSHGYAGFRQWWERDKRAAEAAKWREQTELERQQLLDAIEGPMVINPWKALDADRQPVNLDELRWQR